LTYLLGGLAVIVLFAVMVIRNAEAHDRERKLTKRFGGYLAYTLSRSTREVGRERFLSAFDRTHVGNVAAAYDLGRLWRVGGRFTLYTGTPVVPPGGNALIPPPRSLSPDRDPMFYRLDLRLEKRWNLSKRVWIAFVAEVFAAGAAFPVLGFVSAIAARLPERAPRK